MGGATAKRKNNPIRLIEIDSKERGKYGDPIGKKICDVETETIQLPTRLLQWRVTKIGETKSTDRRSAMRPSGSDVRSDSEEAFAAQPPWNHNFQRSFFVSTGTVSISRPDGRTAYFQLINSTWTNQKAGGETLVQLTAVMVIL